MEVKIPLLPRCALPPEPWAPTPTRVTPTLRTPRTLPHPF